jgi:hypothetical protein
VSIEREKEDGAPTQHRRFARDPCERFCGTWDQQTEKHSNLPGRVSLGGNDAQRTHNGGSHKADGEETQQQQSAFRCPDRLGDSQQSTSENVVERRLVRLVVSLGGQRPARTTAGENVEGCSLTAVLRASQKPQLDSARVSSHGREDLAVDLIAMPSLHHARREARGSGEMEGLVRAFKDRQIESVKEETSNHQPPQKT